jgi:hypothetical protein
MAPLRSVTMSKGGHNAPAMGMCWGPGTGTHRPQPLQRTHPVGHVVHHDDAVRAAVVRAGDGAESLLPSSVPLYSTHDGQVRHRDGWQWGFSMQCGRSTAAVHAAARSAQRTICSLTVLSPILTVRNLCSTITTRAYHVQGKTAGNDVSARVPSMQNG